MTVTDVLSNTQRINKICRSRIIEESKANLQENVNGKGEEAWEKKICDIIYFEHKHFFPVLPKFTEQRLSWQANISSAVEIPRTVWNSLPLIRNPTT